MAWYEVDVEITSVVTQRLRVEAETAGEAAELFNDGQGQCIAREIESVEDLDVHPCDVRRLGD